MNATVDIPLPQHPRRAQDAVPLLTVSDLQVGFPVRQGRLQAVRNVSLTINEGAVFAIVGESGCGKSSLARTICGMYRPDAGAVHFRGIDVHAAGARTREVRRGVQMLFQEPLPSLNPRHAIRRILWEPMQANRIARRLRDAEADMVGQLAAVGLPAEALDRFPRDFSGGQLQRIALARILLLKPSLICADEPVSALDVSVQAQVVHLLERLRVEQSLTYLVISHDLPLVSRIADRVAVMYLGEVVEAGPADEVACRPRHPYTVALRSATPVARSSELERRRVILKGEPPSAISPPPGCAFHTRCPVARPLCRERKPELASVPEGGRRVACHFPGSLELA